MKYSEEEIRKKLDALQPEPGRRGGKTRQLDRMADMVLEKLNQGVTYRQMSDNFASVGFEISEHTIAAWKKRLKKKTEDTVAAQPPVQAPPPPQPLLEVSVPAQPSIEATVPPKQPPTKAPVPPKPSVGTIEATPEHSPERINPFRSAGRLNR